MRRRGTITCGALVFLGVAAGAARAQEDWDRGRVVNPKTGKGVRGAIIASRDPGEHAMWMHRKPMGFESERGGRFTVFPNMIGQEICAVALGRGCSDWVKVPKTGEVVLNIYKGNAITGVVRNGADGPPAPDVDVELTIVRPPFSDDAGPIVVTDKQGRFRFAGIPPGQPVRVRVLRTLRVRSAPGPTPAPIAFDGVQGAKTLDLVAAFRPGVWVTYVLQAPAGASLPKTVTLTYLTLTSDPVSKADDDGVELEFGREESLSETRWRADGRLHLRLRHTDSETIDPAKPGFELFAPVGKSRVHVVAGALVAVSEPRVLERAGPGTTVTLKLRPRRRVYAQLVDDDGTPVRKAGVEVKLHGYLQVSGNTTIQFGDAGESDRRGRVDVAALLPALETDWHGPRKLFLWLQGQGHGAADESGFFGGMFSSERPDGSWTAAQLQALLEKPDADGVVVLSIRPTKAKKK